MKRTTLGLVVAAIMAVSSTGVAAAAHSRPAGGFDRQPVVQEWKFDGTPKSDQPTVGRSVLRRGPDRLDARVRIAGLEPGGVYTFWWVVVQGEGVFPDDIFLAYGANAIADDRGRANVRMSAGLGQVGITGFAPDGVNEILFAALEEPLTATVRVEIAYHGQADEAGDELPVWLADFWTGSECPPDTPNPNPSQPHCPVYYAATHPAPTS